MKKVLSMLIVLTFMLLLSVPASARTCGRLRHRHGNYWHTHSACVGDGHKHGRSFWQKHRDKLTTAGGVGAGALIGGIAGGKRARLSERWPAVAVRQFTLMESASVARVPDTEGLVPDISRTICR